MEIPETLPCDRCGDESPILMIGRGTFAGEPVFWPKSTVRGADLYTYIRCSKCGERELLISEPDIPNKRSGP